MFLSAQFKNANTTTRHCLKSLVQFVRNAHDVPVFKYVPEKKQTHKDRLYVWGYAGIGALGETEFLKPSNNKKRVYRVRKPWRLRWCDRTDANVKRVACGNGFSLIAVAGDGRIKGDKLYGTGMNTQSQIGIHKINSKNEALGYLIEPGLIHLPYNLPDKVKILNISCGRSHSVVNTNEGIFTFGNNSYGQCGRKVIENEEYFGNTAVIQRIENFMEDKNDEIIDVKCGQDHTCFLTKLGKVYTCGWSADGQLGQGIFTLSDRPKLVKDDLENVKIKKIATKGDFVLALSSNGEIFGWGNNEYKQLFMSGIKDPQIGNARFLQLPGYVKRPIVDIACSGTHCIILDNKHQVWVWGFGLLGKGPKCDESVEPLEIPQTLFGIYKEIPHTLTNRVNSVHCGLNCSAVLMDNGVLYMWGSNRYGTLGTGDVKDVYFPIKIHIPSRVRSLDCGADQTFAICRTFI